MANTLNITNLTLSIDSDGTPSFSNGKYSYTINMTGNYVSLKAGTLKIYMYDRRGGNEIFELLSKGVAVNAGHEHPAIRRAGGEYELVVYRHSVAVATMEDIRFREHEFELKPGDSFFVYTDGVAEATSAEKEMSGRNLSKTLFSTIYPLHS